MYKAVMAYPEVIEKPQELAFAIDLALDLEELKEAGARFTLNELSEGAWAALLGLQSGRARAQRERETEKEQD